MKKKNENNIPFNNRITLFLWSIIYSVVLTIGLTSILLFIKDDLYRKTFLMSLDSISGFKKEISINIDHKKTTDLEK